MSPLALYIEQASFHEPFFFPSPIPNVSVYPPSPPNNQIFDSLHSAPTLEKSRTNRVLLYPGSFNPPHRGHLHLLKHAFTRGTHDLNVIAAMVLPHSDASVYTKVKAENGKFMFGIEERCLLWKQDLCFPAWAWVYNKSGQSFAKFSERLLQVVEKDGFSLEFVPLYGAGIASPDSPPSPAYGCKTIIMTNAARRADFQRSSGRLRDFEGCTKWRGIRINKDRLRHNAELYASRNLLEMKTICPQEAYNMLKDGHAYVKEATETMFARVVEEMKAVVTCTRRSQGQTLNLRFLKCEDVDPRAAYNDISSTTLREIMSRKSGIKLREALDWMALSADLLWRCRASWIDKARSGTGSCIKLEESIEELQRPESPRSYEEPPKFDNPPSLEELKLTQVFEQSPPIEEAPSLDSPKLQEESPTVEDRQSLEEPLATNNKKRKFSEMGLTPEEAFVVLGEYLDESTGIALLAGDAG